MKPHSKHLPYVGRLPYAMCQRRLEDRTMSLSVCRIFFHLNRRSLFDCPQWLFMEKGHFFARQNHLVIRYDTENHSTLPFLMFDISFLMKNIFVYCVWFANAGILLRLCTISWCINIGKPMKNCFVVLVILRCLKLFWCLVAHSPSMFSFWY